MCFIIGNTKYSLEHLDLYETLNQKETTKLDKSKFEDLIREMSKTNIKETLKTVHFRKDFYSRKRAQKTFDKYGFAVEVSESFKWPHSNK